MNINTDIVVVGSGAAGLFCALNLPKDKKIIIITKNLVDRSDSFLAQGGICVLKDEDDYANYFEDTMKAGHYENRKESVEIMIRSSKNIIEDLIGYGVDFERNTDGSLKFTKEGGHSDSRILFHADITGKEITSTLLERVKELKNVEIIENCMMLDIIEKDRRCQGLVVSENGKNYTISADYTIFACGGLGGLYKHSTNFRHITGDALAIAMKHDIKTEHLNYIQIHPTTLYSDKTGRRFLISESVRGEGAVLLNKNKERFVNELLPRDLLTKEVRKQMEKDNTPYVWLSMAPIDENHIREHFPNIYQKCLEEGYDCTKECIPVVPAQHYFMGGIWVDSQSKSSMSHLYAIGETSCNGVHGRNRLASNSLLESLVFAKRCAGDIRDKYEICLDKEESASKVNLDDYKDIKGIKEKYKKAVQDEIRKENEDELR